MVSRPSKLDAVRLAKEQLGDAPARELASFVEERFGISITPTIVTVLLATLRERDYLDQGKRRILEAASQATAQGAEATTSDTPR